MNEQKKQNRRTDTKNNLFVYFFMERVGTVVLTNYPNIV